MANRGPPSSQVAQEILAAGPPLAEFVKGCFYYGLKTGLNHGIDPGEVGRDALIAADQNCECFLKLFSARQRPSPMETGVFRPLAHRHPIFGERNTSMVR